MRGCWGRVLIETLWNVNFAEEGIAPTSPARFNRNIVECKYTQYKDGTVEVKGFNRNIVECKLNRRSHSATSCSSF